MDDSVVAMHLFSLSLGCLLRYSLGIGGDYQHFTQHLSKSPLPLNPQSRFEQVDVFAPIGRSTV